MAAFPNEARSLSRSKIAVDEYLENNNINLYLSRIDRSGRIAIVH